MAREDSEDTIDKRVQRSGLRVVIGIAVLLLIVLYAGLGVRMLMERPIVIEQRITVERVIGDEDLALRLEEALFWSPSETVVKLQRMDPSWTAPYLIDVLRRDRGERVRLIVQTDRATVSLDEGDPNSISGRRLCRKATPAVYALLSMGAAGRDAIKLAIEEEEAAGRRFGRVWFALAELLQETPSFRRASRFVRSSGIAGSPCDYDEW